MPVYAVVSLETEKAVDLFPTREDAERTLEEMRADESELAALLRVEPISLGDEGSN